MVHSDRIWNNLKLQGKNENNDVCLMVHFDGIWNDLELQRSFWHKDTFACIIVTHSETIFETALKRNSTCFDLTKGREILKIRAVNGAFCRYL